MTLLEHFEASNYFIQGIEQLGHVEGAHLMSTGEHIAVFGPSGRVGGAVLEQALAAGHRVTAIARTPAKVTINHDRLEVLAADATRPDQVLEVLGQTSGLTAVVMAVGSDPLKASTVVTDSVRSIVAAMTQLGVSRYLGVSGTANMPTTTLRGRLSLVPVRRFIKAAADHAAAYEIVRTSDLDYVLAGCPYIRDGASAASYREEPGPFPGGFKTITPAEVADFLVREIVGSRYHHQIVGIWH
jgi:putative NADH-flavin reductase